MKEYLMKASSENSNTNDLFWPHFSLGKWSFVSVQLKFIPEKGHTWQVCSLGLHKETWHGSLRLGLGNLALLESREIARFYTKISHDFCKICEICEIWLLTKLLPLRLSKWHEKYTNFAITFDKKLLEASLLKSSYFLKTLNLRSSV